MRREYVEPREDVASEVISRNPYTLDPVRATRLYRLINNGYFFLRYVFILADKDDFRLVVIHDNRLLTDKHYKRLSHAKSAFTKIYSRKSWKKGVKPEWSTSFPPDIKWVKDEIRHSIKVEYSHTNSHFKTVQSESKFRKKIK